MTARLDTSPCPVPAWLPDRHSQTLYATLAAAHHRIAFVRERVEAPDSDFVDFDWAGPGLFPTRTPPDAMADALALPDKVAAMRWMTPSDWQGLPSVPDTPALMLFHGLEGGSSSRYAQAIAQHFRGRGWVVVIAHFRGCSGYPNRLARAYYSGDSDEIGFMLQAARARLPNARWHAVGVSLGGNALLKYLGEQGQAAQPLLSAAAGVSVPLDLVAAGNCLSRGVINRQIYSRYFLRTMKSKVLEKASRFPGALDVHRITHARDLREFDDAYTAPMHGFRNALDYWSRAASKPWLAHIQVPTLVLNARNDPFLPEPALPGPAECSASVLLHQPAEGGHAGFPTGVFPGHLSWLPQRLARYFDTRL
ncbi:Hydrolase, alpha/beta fold family functionally coupled to Phosphoribulokinase [plant metagenome]|uniref:Hydrolase, alpha/beta fold family functionally coupled to Phosphoribulokinase n=1 Tax=plant metagenome TaxID=1297885 RepID=A0A484UNK9_9ZZZZ